MRSSSSIMFSAGAFVGWTMKTSRPRAFLSIRTNSSPSAKLRIVAVSIDFPSRSAISSARGMCDLPETRRSGPRRNVSSMGSVLGARGAPVFAIETARKTRPGLGMRLGPDLESALLDEGGASGRAHLEPDDPRPLLERSEIQVHPAERRTRLVGPRLAPGHPAGRRAPEQPQAA